jgi:prepilin-type N-terminal cleavage/methylation domain-containing protein
MAMWRKKGFTLVEVLFVLVIALGIAAYAVPNYRRSQERSRYEAALGLLTTYGNAISTMERDMESDGYNFTFPMVTIYFQIPPTTVNTTGVQTDSVEQWTDIVGMRNTGNNANKAFMWAMLKYKYAEKLPSTDSGYSFYAIGTNTASICGGNCKQNQAGGSPVMMCMCQSITTNSTGCYYGARMLRNGRIEKFVKSGNSSQCAN